MGRSAGPFKGFVHKCDRMQLLQCLRWQVVQSAGDVSDSAFIHTAPPPPPLFPILCLLLFHEQSHKYKSERMQSVFAMLCLPHFSLPNVMLYRPTSRRRYCRENKAELQPRTTSDGDSLLLPPFHRFAFLILPSFTPLIHCHFLLSRVFIFKALMFPVGFLWWPIWKRKEKWKQRNWRTNGWISSRFKFLSCTFAKVCFLDAAAKLLCAWLRKNISKHMVFVCSLNWINWRPMGNHQGG